MPYITDTYTPLERRRLTVPQGLTGLWQLSGDRRFIIHEAIEYDFYYIENRGIFLDFAILLHTLFFAMKGFRVSDRDKEKPQISLRYAPVLHLLYGTVTLSFVIPSDCLNCQATGAARLEVEAEDSVPSVPQDGCPMFASA